MAQRSRRESTRDAERTTGQEHSVPEARDSTVRSMVSASLLAVLGTLIFAWALRTPDYPWLFGVGAVPWFVGVVMFGRALWRYTHL